MSFSQSLTRGCPSGPGLAIRWASRRASEIPSAFAFNQPVVFIETNIRRVFLHCFFPGQSGVRDREILPLVDQNLDRRRPRLWYSALMDYGTMLKRTGPNPNLRHAHHQRQAP